MCLLYSHRPSTLKKKLFQKWLGLIRLSIQRIEDALNTGAWMQDLPLTFFFLLSLSGEGVGLLYQAHEAVGGVGHGLDGRVRHGFELGVGEFVLGADVDEGAFVAGAVAIMGGGED
jgi:hypothetical protein